MRRALFPVMTAMLIVALEAPTVTADEPVRPPNDDIGQATPIAYPFTTSTVERSVDNSAATAEAGEPHPCGGSDRTVWYMINVPSTVPLALLLVEDNGSPNHNLRLAAGRIQDGTFTTLACGGGSWATTQLSPGSTAYVQVMDDGTGGGELRLRFSILPAPANDSFYSAEEIIVLPMETSVDNRAATRQSWPVLGMEPLSCGASSRTVWYRLFAPGDGRVTVTPDLALLDDPTLQAFLQTGSSVTTLTPGSCSAGGSLTFDVRQGLMYYVQVADIAEPVSLESRGGTLNLTFGFQGGLDTTRPVLTLPAETVVEATGSTGSVVAFEATAEDDIDGAVAVACDPASGSTFALGPTTVWCRAADRAGNTAYGSFVIRVVDTTPPDVAYGEHPPTYLASETVAITCTAADVVGVATTTCADVNAPAWSFGTGTHTLAATAADAAGNSAEATTAFTVQVSYPAVKTLTSQWVWKTQIASQLKAYLDAAAKAERNGNVKAEASNLASFRSLLAAQTGKSVSDTNARMLAALTQDL